MTDAALRFNGVGFSYHGDRPALEGVSFSIAAGEKVALLGANGAGKSTVFLLATGLHLPHRGVIEVGALRLSKEHARAIRQRLSLVFADPDDQLFCSSVLEEVAFAPRRQGQPEAQALAFARELLAQVGLQQHEEREPLQLSLGEKKRVALAAAMATKSSLLLLDEPTAGLDPRGRRELIGILSKLSCALLVATHDLEAARQLCPRSIVLDGGRIVADTATESLLEDSALLLQHGLA